MSTKLDKSLDEIISTQRRTSGRGRGARRTTRPTGKATPAAPVGGVKKNARNQKPAVKAVPTGPAGGSGEGRVLISGLPKDVDEKMIKEYFAKQVGPIKRVEISYGPGGVSRGSANITFAQQKSAVKAVAECNGIPIDGKPIKVELLVDANVAKSIPPPKALSERVTQSKAQPKSAAATKATAASSTRGKKAARGGRGGRTARPAKKTADELDTEMAEYFSAAPETAATQTAAAPTADANMDEIL